MFGAEISLARRRWRIVALFAGVLVAIAPIAAFMLMRSREEPVLPSVVPAQVAPAPDAEPAPAPAAPQARIDEPIWYIAAASDAPVIAVASARRVWISRDDGNTFAPALRHVGAEVHAVSVEPSGRVYVMWDEHKVWRSPGGGGVDTIESVLGIADLDGRERWRPMDSMIAPPLDTRGDWIVGAGGIAIGSNAGESWRRVPSSSRWHVWLASIDDLHTARFLASRLDAPESCLDCGRGLALLATREGRHPTTIWSMLDKTAISTEQFPRNLLACAGFAGSTLYLIARERAGLRLIAVGGDGKVRKTESIGAGLPADVSCTIGGNDRAAYVALGDDMIRIDTDEQRVAPAEALTPGSPNNHDEIAVDAHGFLLYVADACVWRYTGDLHRREVVCGPHR